MENVARRGGVSEKAPQNKITLQPPGQHLTLATRESTFYERYVSISLITSPSQQPWLARGNPPFHGVENDVTRYITGCYAPPFAPSAE